MKFNLKNFPDLIKNIFETFAETTLELIDSKTHDTTIPSIKHNRLDHFIII